MKRAPSSPFRLLALPSPHRPRVDGFTLIEVMVVVSILGVLIALAAPNFRDVIDRYRVRQTIEDLKATLYLARTEAIKRGGHVTIAQAAGANCTTAQEWSCGWIVFEDLNENGTQNAGDTLLQKSPTPSNVNVMLYKGNGAGPKSMKIDRWGSYGGMGAFSFKLKPANNNKIELAMELCMSSGGRLRTVKGAEECNP